MTQQQNPWDVVEYWHGHAEIGPVGPYDVLRSSYVDAVMKNLSDWDFIKFKLRNGQIIRVRPKR